VIATAALTPEGVEERLEAAASAAEASGMRRPRIETVRGVGRAGDALLAIAEEKDVGVTVVARGEGATPSRYTTQKNKKVRPGGVAGPPAAGAAESSIKLKW